MKGVRASDLRTRSEDELGEQVENLSKEIFNLRFQRASGQLENTARVRQVRREIEAARRAITRHIRRVGRVWIRIFPDVPVSAKPAEVRMGSGKGSPEFWVSRVKPGRIMFELDGVPYETAREASTLAAAKLSIATRFVQRLGEEAH